jgi:hypothetical protein
MTPTEDNARDPNSKVVASLLQHLKKKALPRKNSSVIRMPYTSREQARYCSGGGGGYGGGTMMRMRARKGNSG